MKRNLLLVTLFLAIGLVAAAPNALAQVVFGVSSNVNQVRLEGTAEAVGQVVLNAQSSGTIVAGSNIYITYFTTITNAAIVTTGNNISCGGFSCSPNITTTASGDVLTLAFTGPITLAVGNTITIKGVRVDANAFGVGTINASATASVPAGFVGTNPITFTGATSVPVANVNKLATTVTFSQFPETVLTVTYGLPGVAGSLITCIGAAGSGASNGTNFTLNVAENFGDALTSLSDEMGLAPGTDVTNGSNILITLTGVPNGVTITPAAAVPCQDFPVTQANFCAGGLLKFELPSPATFTSTSANSTVSFFYQVDTTNTTLIENADFPFQVTSSTLPSGLVPNAITGTVSLTEANPPVSTNIPFFVGNESSFPVVNLADCVTDILLPYVTNFTGSGTAPDSHYDTGITVSNTTLDPFGTNGGAMPQAGSCTLTLFPSTGAAGIPYTTASVPAGGQVGVTVGTVPHWGGLTGYIIGTCDFQNAHSFVSVYDNAGLGSPGFQQGYVGLIIPNPSLAGNARSPAGKGAGESLGE